MKIEPLKFIFVVCTALVAAAAPALAEEKRFLEMPGPTGNTEIYDLATVQMITPGRFTIKSTSLDDADVIKFKLKVLDVQRDLCARPAGKYRPPQEVFTLGPPDMPVSDIEVTLNSSGAKFVQWPYPYKRMATGSKPDIGFFRCGAQREYLDSQMSITNGVTSKHLYDCKRGLEGFFFPGSDDPTQALAHFVRVGTFAAQYYELVCLAVTHKEPFMPK